jgi:signal transduction histidine kinase
MTGAPVSEVIGLFPDPAAIFDADGNLAHANKAFAKSFASIEQFVRAGSPWSIFLAEAERKGALSPNACNELRLIEEHLLHQPGVPPVVETLLADGAEALVALANLSDGGFAMRITLNSQQEDREVEQVMAKVLEACPTSLTMARIGDGQILYRSPAASELLGKGMNSHDHFARREDRADFVTALLPDARVDDMRITGRRGDGTEFPASISAQLIDYRGEDVVVYSILNLSDEIAMQSQLARQKDLIFRAEKMSALGEMLAGVAHELNNPLSIVVGNMLLLKEEDLSPKIIGRVDKVSDAAERCVRIVRSFLSMARDRPLDLATVSPSILVDTAIDGFLADDQSAKVDVISDVHHDLPELLVDETQIVQVLINLFVNAAQAMAETGIGDTITISAETSDSDRTLCLTVQDNGPGIPKDIAEKIFDPLFTTKSAGKGTGVGLALCNRIVTSHGGTITLRQTSGTGASFLLELPITQ